MTLDEINSKIKELEDLRFKLRQEQIKKDKEEAKQYVGNCYLINGIYIKILDTPQEEYNIYGSTFNKYQYPALFVKPVCTDARLIPIEVDNFFYGEFSDNKHRISQKEFNKMFYYVLNTYKEKVEGIKDGE